MSTTTNPEQTSTQPPSEDGRMTFSIGTNELRAARLFMDYEPRGTPGLILSACALNARMIAHDRYNLFIQRLRQIEILYWDGQDTVVVVPIELIDKALDYAGQLSAKKETSSYDSIEFHVTPGMPNPLGQLDHAQRRQVEMTVDHRAFVDREAICSIPKFERNIPKEDDESTPVEYPFLTHSRIQQANKLITGEVEAPAIVSHWEKPGIVAINEYVLLLVMPMHKEDPEPTPEWAYLQATPRFELPPQAPVQGNNIWERKFADSTPDDLFGGITLIRFPGDGSNGPEDVEIDLTSSAL